MCMLVFFLSSSICRVLTEKDCDQLLVLASDLYNILEDNNCLGKHFRQRSTVLKVIFRLLDVEDTKLLLKLARLILAVSARCPSFGEWCRNARYGVISGC